MTIGRIWFEFTALVNSPFNSFRLVNSPIQFGIDNDWLKNYNDIADFLFCEPEALYITHFQGGVSSEKNLST
jgi:hypothetical protein